MEKLYPFKIRSIITGLLFCIANVFYSQNVSMSERINFNDISEISFGEMSDIDIVPIESSPEKGNYCALIISNETYKRVPNVPYSLNDGNTIHRYFNKVLGVPERNIVHIENATYNDMKYAINNIELKCKAFPNQIQLYIYYSGHGIPDERGEAYLLPIDGIGTDPTSGYNLYEFYEQLNGFKTKSTIVFIDACFSGTRRDGGMLLATRGITIKPKTRIPSGNLLVFTATSGEETAFPIENQQHGLFTYSVLAALKDAGDNITWGDLTDKVINDVIHASIDLTGKTQTPTVLVSPNIADKWRNMKIR